ncbi:hypothetical protein CVIRNUC_001569 [Coccomyxa viridis]|uniref:RRM domain-containing protein n=1 Tax=Coccomyxa viridis TaxID=1274662 RepID=A0AAV1HXK3_9CHLO|nr:hypothetical protein CVIRNUC_001569 [Coccomyxa viridis]
MMMALQGNFRRTGRWRIYMNVGYILDETQLTRYFSQFGTVTDCYLPKHKSGRNKGFGFTTFEAEPDLERTLQSAEHVIDGVMVKINRAGPRPEHEHPQDDKPQSTPSTACADAQPASPTGAHGRGPRLYVGGVPDEITEEDIVEHFNKWGQVVDCYFPGKKGAKRVNYCFITFDNWRSAQRACNQSERNIFGKPLQSISMAEERQGEAHADGLAKLSSMQANAALQQALTLANSTNAAVYGSSFAQAPALPQPANGLAALQTLFANGLVAPDAISGLLAALAGSPGTPRQNHLAPAPLANSLSFQGAPQQGMPVPSDMSTVEALLEEYQGSLTAAAGGHAVGGAVRTLDGITDPLASLDASIKGTLSSGNVSLLKPWGQPIPEGLNGGQTNSGGSSPTSPPGAPSTDFGNVSNQGEEVNSAPSQITPQQSTSVMPLTGQTGFLGGASHVGQPHRAPSLPALHTQMLMASATSQAALNNMAARAAVSPTPGPHFARQVQPELHTLPQMACRGMPGAEQSAHQPGAFLQAADTFSTPLALPFGLQPAAPALPIAFNGLSPQLSGCKPTPYRAYHSGTDPGLRFQGGYGPQRRSGPMARQNLRHHHRGAAPY